MEVKIGYEHISLELKTFDSCLKACDVELPCDSSIFCHSELCLSHSPQLTPHLTIHVVSRKKQLRIRTRAAIMEVTFAAMRPHAGAWGALAH